MSQATLPDRRPTSQTWHLYWQAASGRDFLSHETLRQHVKHRLFDAHSGTERILLAYCLLPGEIHSVTRLSGEAQPGDIARAFGSVVSRWVRKVQRARGPVLAAPFCAVAINSDQELRDLIRMLAWRPVVVGRSASPAQYADASVRCALGLSASDGFAPRHLLQELAETVPLARAELRKAISRRPSADEWRLWELTHGLDASAGQQEGPSASAVAARSIEAAMLIAASPTCDVEGALRLLQRAVERLVGEPVLGATDVPEATSVRVRALVGLSARRFRLCSAATVARFYARAKSTMSEQMAEVGKGPWGRRMAATPIDTILTQGSRLG